MKSLIFGLSLLTSLYCNGETTFDGKIIESPEGCISQEFLTSYIDKYDFLDNDSNTDPELVILKHFGKEDICQDSLELVKKLDKKPVCSGSSEEFLTFTKDRCNTEYPTD
jgi:hypothetical protein